MASISKTILTLAILFSSAFSQAMTPEEAKKKMKDHVAVRVETWAERLKRPLPPRIAQASQVVLEYLAYDNFLNGLPAPKEDEFGPPFVTSFRAILNQLSPDLKRMLKERLVGVFAVKNLGSTGYTEAVRDKDGKIVAAFIAIDVERVKQKANDWASERENGLFEKGEFKVRVKMLADERDKGPEAAQFILLHEIGHVISLFTQQVPDWFGSPRPEWSKLPFLNFSWVGPKYEGTKFAGFPTDLKLKFYKTPAPNANSRLPELYAWLEKTDFPSSYAAQNPQEDFAESFAHWARLKRLGKPYSLSIYKGDTLIKTYLSCFAGPRCAAKAALFEAMWKPPDKSKKAK